MTHDMHGLVDTWGYPDGDVLAGFVLRTESLSKLRDSSRAV